MNKYLQYPSPLASLVPAPSFRIGSNGRINPSIGTGGTFTRTGSIWYTNSANTMAKITDNNVPIQGAVPSNIGAPGTPRKGFMVPGIMRNECQQTTTFEAWTPIGSPTIDDNAAVSPTGDSDAAHLVLADGEGARLTLVQNATDFPGAWMAQGLWMRAVSGTPTIMLRTRDSGGPTYQDPVSNEVGHILDDTWRVYSNYGQNPDPGSGFLQYEITAIGAANIQVWGAWSQFTGQEDAWDTNSIGGGLMAYYAVCGASRLSTGANKLFYQGEEISFSMTEMTVSTWVYLPLQDMFYKGNDFWIFGIENSDEDVIGGIWSDFDELQIKARFASTTDRSANIDIPMGVQNRWVNFTWVCKSGANRVYMDGVPILVDANTVSSFTPVKFYPGAFHPEVDTVERFMYPIGETSIWPAQSFTQDDVTNYYNISAAEDALPDPAVYNFPTAGAAEILRFNGVSGNLTSLLNDTYVQNGSITRMTQGPGGMKGSFIAQDQYYNVASANAAWNVGALQSFVFMTQQMTYKLTDKGGDRVIFDSSNYGTDKGFLIILDETRLDFYYYDDSATGGISRWVHGGELYDNNKFVTIRWVFNRANPSATLYYKYEGEPEVGPIATTAVLNDFSALGACTQGGTAMRFGGRLDNGASNFFGSLFQAAIAVGSTTYNPSSLP